MKALMDQVNDQSCISPLLVHYRDINALEKSLLEVKHTCGEIDLMVVWIRSDAKSTFTLLSEQIREDESHFYHVISSTANPIEMKKR